MFAEELRRLDGIDEDPATWELAYDAVRKGVVLRYPDGRDVREFLLHVDDGTAWWRWSDEPFRD